MSRILLTSYNPLQFFANWTGYAGIAGLRTTAKETLVSYR